MESTVSGLPRLHQCQMSKVIATAVVAVSLIAAGVAMGSHLSIHRAAQESRHFAKRKCDGVRHCHDYGVARCVKITGHRVDCRIFLEFKYRRAPRRSTCTTWLGWRLRSHGSLRISTKAPPRCVTGWRF
jgi:hypothetical protein